MSFSEDLIPQAKPWQHFPWVRLKKVTECELELKRAAGLRDEAALTKSIADAFLQEATHAPHPMQAAASIACSATFCEISIEFASGADPVLTET